LIRFSEIFRSACQANLVASTVEILPGSGPPLLPEQLSISRIFKYMAHAWRISLALGATCLLSGCAGSSAIQPDRSIFSLDNNYQRYAYAESIEETFDRTVTVFREAGYKLDVIDRATGQISGLRGATGDKGSVRDKDLKFYALVLPKSSGSELGIKIVQVIKSGALGSSKAELIVNDPQMYQYAFRRIGNTAQAAVPPY
jgi:hypothetical protein